MQKKVVCGGHSIKREIFFKGLMSGAGAQFIMVALGLISVPIGLSYLGSFQYGIWMVISSIIAYLGLSQFGMGTATTALIAKHVERKNQGAIFRQSFRLLCYLALFSIALSGVAAMFSEGWSMLFGDIPNDARHDAISATVAMIVLYLLRLPTVAFTSAYIGLQEVHWERLYAIVLPAILSFFALLLTIYLGGGLVMLAYLTGGAQLLAGLLAGLHFSIRHHDMLRSAVSIVPNVTATKDLIPSGRRFFIIGIAAAVVWYTDNLVISYFLGPESVTAYSVTFKLFAAAFSILVLANTVLMPMFGNAVGRSDWLWVSEIYKNALSVMVVFGGLVWIGGVLFAEPIILLWTGSVGYGGGLVVFALGGYGYVLAAVNLHANILSGMNATRAMLWIGIAEAIVNFVLSFIFIRWWGIGGVALGTFMSALLTVYWLLPKDVERQTQSRVKVSWPQIVRHFGFAVFPGIGAASYLAYIAHGAVLWAAGVVLCAIYLIVSLWLLPQQAKTMLMRMAGAKI